MCSNTFSWIFCNFSFFDIFSTSNQKFINSFATSLLSSGSKILVNAFGSRSKKYRKTKNYQKSMKMCSNTYLMPVLSNFGLLTPLLALLGTVNVQNPLILADFGRSYAFTSEAFIWPLWASAIRQPSDSHLRMCRKPIKSSRIRFHNALECVLTCF